EQDERLDRVEPGGVALELVAVLRALPVLAERDDHVRQRVDVRDERARVARGAEVLARIEGEGRGDAGRAGAEAVARRAVRLAGVLDEREAEGLQRAHVRELAIEVDGEDEASAAAGC